MWRVDWQPRFPLLERVYQSRRNSTHGCILSKARHYGLPSYWKLQLHSVEDLLDSSDDYFSDLSDITLNMYYINSSHHLNSLVIISVTVDTASPSLLYLQAQVQSSCAKLTSLTACCSMMIYNWCFTDKTVVCLHWCSFCVSVLCACIFIVCIAFDKVLLKNSITTTTTSRHLLQTHHSHTHRCTKRARWIHATLLG